MTDLDLSALEAAATERAANGLSGMNVSPPTVLALLAEVAALRQQVAEVEAERLCSCGYGVVCQECMLVARSRAETAEQTVAAQARVIEQVREWANQYRRQWVPGDKPPGYDFTFDMGVGAAAHDVLDLLAAAPTPPTEAEETDDEFWGRLLGDDDPAAPGKDWVAAAFGDDDDPDPAAVGTALVALGKASFDRGDLHEYRHALAAIRAGDSTSCTADRCHLDGPTPPTTDAQEATEA